MAMLTRASWVKIILIALFCLVLCCGIVGCSMGCTSAVRHMGNIASTAYDGVDFENKGDFTIDTNENLIEEIEIIWFAGGVDVVLGEPDGGNEIVGVEELSGPARDSLRMSWQLRNGVLQISYGVGNWGLFGCGNFNSKHLTLTLPRSFEGSLETFDLTAASGNYNIDSVMTEYLNIDLASGTVYGNDLEVQNLNLDIASGNVKVTGIFENTVDVDMASGGAEIKSLENCPEHSAFDVMSGQLDLWIPEDSSFTATVDKMSGSFYCGLESSWASSNPNLLTCNGGEKPMSISMASGNFNIFSLGE